MPNTNIILLEFNNLFSTEQPDLTTSSRTVASSPRLYLNRGQWQSTADWHRTLFGWLLLPAHSEEGKFRCTRSHYYPS